MAAMCSDNTKYTHSQGLIELRKAIATKYKSKFNVDISPDQIIVTSGTSPAMLLLFVALIDPQDEIIMANPHYACKNTAKDQQNLFISTNAFVQYAGISALEGPQEQLREMIETYSKRRLYLIKRLKDIGFGVKTEPKGAYYVLADARKFGNDSLKLSRNILGDIGVAVTPGIDFGHGAEGYLRFSYANSLENIKEGMDRLEAYLKK